MNPSDGKAFAFAGALRRRFNGEDKFPVEMYQIIHLFGTCEGEHEKWGRFAKCVTSEQDVMTRRILLLP